MPIDYRDYPDNWPALSFRIRYARAESRCECEGECGRGHVGRCEAHHGQPHPDTGSAVVLTVAHLCHDDCSEATDTRKCGEPGHLRAMCQACHLSLDAAHHARNAAQTRRRQRIEAGQMEMDV